MRIRNCPATVYPCAPARASVRGPADSAPRPTRPGRRRPGLVEWAGGRDAVCARALPPALREAPAERGRAPRDHRASRSGPSTDAAGGRRSRCRAAAHPDRADRRPPRRRPRPGRRRRAARPLRPRGRGGAAGAGHGGRRRAHLRGPRLLPAGRPAADPHRPRRGRLPGRHVVHRLGRHRAPRGPDRRPHGRVRARARRAARRAGRPGRRRPLRLLRTAHPAQPLPAAPP